MTYLELNLDQRRESINTQQRYQAWRETTARARSARGSMTWATVKGRDYLVRSSYDTFGRRRQSSLGPRSAETEKAKAEFERTREDALKRADQIEEVLRRQSAVNRALGLGRVPLIGARIIRMLDLNGLLGSAVRVLGTNAIYAYEAAAGVRFEPGLTATEDLDLLLDARRRLTFAASEEMETHSLLRLLRRVDTSFERSAADFRAVNRDGYLVDLVKPLRNPPWLSGRDQIGADPTDLRAVEIDGLTWHESSPLFEAVAIDERGEPLRMAASDPRVWAAHKLWLSKRNDREPIKKRRDGEQAAAVAALVRDHLPHLRFNHEDLRMLPKELFEQAASLFSMAPGDA